MVNKYQIGDVVFIQQSRKGQIIAKTGIITHIFPKENTRFWADYQVKIPKILNNDLECLWGVLETEIVKIDDKVFKILYGRDKI